MLNNLLKGQPSQNLYKMSMTIELDFLCIEIFCETCNFHQNINYLIVGTLLQVMLSLLTNIEIRF